MDAEKNKVMYLNLLLFPSYRMDWGLLPAQGSAWFSLLFCSRTDDFGWLELWNSQLEAAADCRICSYICLLLLFPVSGIWTQLLADTAEASAAVRRQQLRSRLGISCSEC